MTEQERFTESVLSLLRDEPFFAHFISECRISWSTKVPTAGVYVREGIPYLDMNEKFTSTLSQAEFTAVLKHEILHLVMLHTSVRPKNSVDQKIWNVAMDCCINQFIDDLPEDTVSLKSVEEVCEKELKPFESAKYYYEALQNSPKIKKDLLDQLKTLDDHGSMMQGDGTASSIAEEIIKRVARNATKKAAGNISESVMRSISGLLDHKVPWQSVLRNFVLRHVNSSTRSSRKKLNRRFGLDAPGKIKKRDLKLGVCIDSSGSIDDQQFAEFLTEISFLLTQDVQAYIVDADCEVKSAYWAKSKKDLKIERQGGGGTAYSPAIEACLKQKVDAIIFFGDMDSSDEPANPRVPVLWIVSGDSNPPGNFGRTVRL